MPEQQRPLKVFLCHASADKPKVRELYRYLKRRGSQPWFDAEDLLPGQAWQVEIPKALSESDAIIICLSKSSVDKEGYIQKEIKFALDKALEMPEGRIFLIPARLEKCEVPHSLIGYHWVDLFDESGYAKLMKSLKVRAAQLERAAVQVSKQAENGSYLAEKPNQESHAGVSMRVSGDVTGNIIIGNDNAVQSNSVQPEPEKPVEAKLSVVPDKKEPEKPPHKLKTGYIIAIIGAVATILAALIGILPQFFSPALVQTALTLTTLAISPSKTLLPSPSPINSIAITPTDNPYIEITDIKGIKMRFVPAGEFMMGSDADNRDEKPAYKITLSDYYMDVYEVTNVLYKACANAGVCLPPKQTASFTRASYYGNPEFDNYPVIYIDWYMASVYCGWRGARLPTEAEWEKAARGADNRTFPWGEEIDSTIANYYGSTGNTTEVGIYEKGKSPYGMYDMAGNVWEWTSDWYDIYPGGDSAASLDFGQTYRVLRGGAWNSISDELRTSYRNRFSPTNWDYVTVGFRCVRSSP